MTRGSELLPESVVGSQPLLLPPESTTQFAQTPHCLRAAPSQDWQGEGAIQVLPAGTRAEWDPPSSHSFAGARPTSPSVSEGAPSLLWLPPLCLSQVSCLPPFWDPFLAGPELMHRVTAPPLLLPYPFLLCHHLLSTTLSAPPPRCWTRASWQQERLYLVHTIGHRLERELSRPIHCLPIVCGAPAGAVDVDQLRHVADGGGLYDVRHKWLVQHPDTCGHMWTGKQRFGSQFLGDRRGGGLSPGCGWRVFHPRCPGGHCNPEYNYSFRRSRRRHRTPTKSFLNPHLHLSLCNYL